MPFTLRLIPAAAAACLLASCGGGGGGSEPPAPPPAAATRGVAVDGYLVGATVLCDSNGNGIADAGELGVGTDAQGRFTFAAGCSAGLVVLGGASADTGLPFTGRLRAPAGSTVVSPLTSLVASGTTQAQLLAALGLPADINLLQTDPALRTGDTLANGALLKKTLAVQQLAQKLSELFVALGASSSTATLQAVYGEVIAAFAAELAAGAVLSTGTSIDEATTARLVKAAAERVRAATTVGTAIPAALALLNAESLGVVLAGGLAAQAEALLQAPDADLGDETLAQQEDTRTTAFVIANRAQLAGPPSAATTALGAQLTDTIAGVEPPPPPTNYLALAGDAISLVNGTTSQAYTMAQFESTGIALAWPVAPKATLSVTLNEVGTYALSADMKLSAAVSIVDTAAGSRGELQAYIDNVSAERTASGLKITVPSTANALVYAVSTDGSKRAIIDFANSVAGVTNTLSTAAGGNSIVFGEVVDFAIKRIGQDFTGVAGLRGTYSVSVVITGLPLRRADGTALPAVTVTVPTALDGAVVTASKSVAGLGLVGRITLTD
jgi:hypothetical protein